VSEPEVVTEQASVPKRRILVVDDNHAAADSLAMFLQMKGHDARAAHDGSTAVAVAEEYQPDVVLMDIGMPEMDGYEATRRLRAEPWGGNLFIVALTGWGTAEDRRRTQKGGFDSHMVKPVRMEALTELLASVHSK
jgi:CheY-like chemotaxis protein